MGRVATRGRGRTPVTAAKAKKARSPLPIFEGLLPIDPSKISVDVIAGATLAALAIPEVMGYTKIAGTPVDHGPLHDPPPDHRLRDPRLVATPGRRCRLRDCRDHGDRPGRDGRGGRLDAVRRARPARRRLMCGAVLILARLLKLGFIANFLSRSVLIGFLTGVGIQVAMGQVGAMFGVPGQSGTTIQKFVETRRSSSRPISTSRRSSSPRSSSSRSSAWAMVNKKIPGALLAVVGLDHRQLRPGPRGRWGHDPRHRPERPAAARPARPAVMTWDNVLALLPTVISLVVVILAQSAATSRAYAMKYSDSFDENVDLVGLGAANLGGRHLRARSSSTAAPPRPRWSTAPAAARQIAQLTAAASSSSCCCS